LALPLHEAVWSNRDLDDFTGEDARAGAPAEPYRGRAGAAPHACDVLAAGAAVAEEEAAASARDLADSALIVMARLHFGVPDGGALG
jgi:hypothetical protein